MKKDIEKLSELLSDLTSTDMFHEVILKDSKLEAEVVDSGFNIKMQGNNISIFWLLAACIKGVIEKDDSLNFERAMIHLKIAYDCLIENSKTIKASNKKEMDVIDKLLSNPEKMEELKKIFNHEE